MSDPKDYLSFNCPFVRAPEFSELQNEASKFLSMVELNACNEKQVIYAISELERLHKMAGDPFRGEEGSTTIWIKNDPV